MICRRTSEFGGRSCCIPERRRLFPFMTVLENLELGAYLPGPRGNRNASLEMVFDLLPVLAERRHQIAGSLSGGEQQMCAIGRALIESPAAPHAR